MIVPSPTQFEAAFLDPVWLQIGKEICLLHRINPGAIRRSEHGESVVLLIDNRYILKIFKPSKNGYAREKAALEFVSGRTSLPIPQIVAAGDFEGFKYLITSQINGELMTRQRWLQLDRRTQLGLIEQLAVGLKQMHSLKADWKDFDWPAFVRHKADTSLELQRSEGGNPEWLESLPRFIDENLALLPVVSRPSFMHGDVHFGNIRVSRKNGRLRINGLFDFADSLKGFHEYEFIAVGVLMIQGQGDLQREFFRMYGYKDSEIDETLRRRMMLLTIFYEWSSLRRYAERLRPEAVTYTLEELERAIWRFV